jgi:hypothetical protein
MIRTDIICKNYTRGTGTSRCACLDIGKVADVMA